jgi:hypothetical protein
MYIHTRYFTSDNEPHGIENATHNTFAKQTWIFPASISRIAFAFSIPPGSPSLVKHPVGKYTLTF